MNSNRQVVIVFKTRYFVTEPGQRLGIVGSLEQLGCWKSSQCLLADESPNVRGNWSTKVTLPVATIFDWKWIVITEDRSFVVRWEERSNRTSAVAVKSGEIMALWNGDTVFTPVTAPRESNHPKDSTKDTVVVASRQVLENKTEIKPILKKSVSRESSPETRRVSRSSSPEIRITNDSSPEIGRRSKESSPVYRRRSSDERVRFKTETYDPYLIKTQEDSCSIVCSDTTQSDVSSKDHAATETEINSSPKNVQTKKSDVVNKDIKECDFPQPSSSGNVMYITHVTNPCEDRTAPKDVSNWTEDETVALLNHEEVREEMIAAILVKDTNASMPGAIPARSGASQQQNRGKMRNGVTKNINTRGPTDATSDTLFSKVKVKCSSVDRLESPSDDSSSTDLRSVGSEENIRSNLKRSPSSIERFFTSMCVIL